MLHPLLNVLNMKYICTDIYQKGGNSHTFCSSESQCEVSSLVLRVELAIWDLLWDIAMDQGTERQSIIPATAEVGDVYIL